MPTETKKPSIVVTQAERDRALVDGLMRKAALARRDPSEFFSFVMREEHGDRRRIKCLPHQKVLFDFVMTYDHCVVRIPPGYSKTYTLAALSMWLVGSDNTARGAVISSTQEQASKPVSMVRDYIGNMTEFPELRLVFPKLAPSKNVHDAWSQFKIVVDRPAGIRDPSLIAIGLNGALPGARLSWILVDDILTEENTRTKEGRDAVNRWFYTTVVSRRDVRGSKLVVANTAWHPDDLTYTLEAAGWPTLTMDAEGDITITNAPEFDSAEIRPSKKPGEVYRLAAHDKPSYDKEETAVLWPSKFSREVLEKIKKSIPAFEYAQMYMNKPRSDEDARCKAEWIETCKKKARDRGIHSLEYSYHGSNPTFTGVDLGIGQDKGHGKTAFFTFEVLPDGCRRILDVCSGQWRAPEIIRRITSITGRYNSIARVENNSAQQFLVDMALEANASIPIEAHTTGRNKAHPEHGLEALFVEIENGAWLIPNDPHGNMPEAVEEWVKACLYYKPGEHTNDILMATWFAREEARHCGCGSTAQSRHEDTGGFGISSLFAR